MKPNLFLSCIVAMLAGLPSVRGQSITPSVLNASGGSGTIGSNTFEWSVGEIMVATLSSTSLIVTQGVLQPKGGPASIADDPLTPRLDVFPNPSSSVVNIQFNSPGSGTLISRVIDVTGKVLIEDAATVKQGSTTRQLDIRQFACATYMLQVTYKTEDNTEKSTTYKIQKLN